MAADYTIKDVDPRVKEWEGAYGPMFSYTVTLDSGQEVELNQKPSTPPPTAGQALHGVIEEGKFGLKFKKVQQNNFTGGRSGSFRPRDPAETKAIQRQHSQEMALRFAEATRSLEGIELQDVEVVKAKLASITRLADYFDRDIANGKAGE